MSQQKQELSSVTLIKDPILEPYFIGKDTYCYTVYENAVSSESPNKTYLRSWGHHNNLGSCLKGIARLKLSKTKEYNSIREYISEWNSIQEKFEQLVNPEIWNN